MGRYWLMGMGSVGREQNGKGKKRSVQNGINRLLTDSLWFIHAIYTHFASYFPPTSFLFVSMGIQLPWGVAAVGLAIDSSANGSTTSLPFPGGSSLERVIPLPAVGAL